MPASKILSFAVKASTALVFVIAIATIEMALIKIFGDAVGYTVLVAFLVLAIVAWRRTITDQAG